MDLLPDRGATTYRFQWQVPPMAPRVHVFSHNWFLCYYGADFSRAALRRMLRYHVIVLDAKFTTPATVAYLQRNGVQPKYVLGYISVGEEHEQAEPVRMSGAQTGPVYFDPRDGQVKHRNLGYATYYVDSVQHEPWHGDGVPDANPNFLGRYVFPDSNWIWRLKAQRLPVRPAAGQTHFTGPRAGFDQLLGRRRNDQDTDRSQNYGFDGLFLDTLDTAGPWNTPLYYPWMAPAYRDMIAWLRRTYPSTVLLANRGIFFYNPMKRSPVYGTRAYDYNIAPFVDIALYESYNLDSNSHVRGTSPYYCDNHCVFGPKLDVVARAQRMLVTGVQYHMGRSDALVARAVDETVMQQGWLDYVSRDGALYHVDTYVLDAVRDWGDAAPPRWRNAGLGFCAPQCRADGRSGECCNPRHAARVGLRRVVKVAGRNQALLQFDYAVDRSNPIFYNVYRSWDGRSFHRVRFNAALQLTREWADGQYGALPYQVAQDLDCSRTQHFRIRAQDAHGNEDTNANTIAVTCRSTVVSLHQRQLLRRRLSWASAALAPAAAELAAQDEMV